MSQQKHTFHFDIIMKHLSIKILLACVIYFITQPIMSQNITLKRITIEPYYAKIINKKFFKTIDSIIGLENVKLKGECQREIYDINLIVHPNKFNRVEWEEISEEVNLKDLDVIVAVYRTGVPVGKYEVMYNKRKYIFRTYIKDLFKITSQRDYIICSSSYWWPCLDWYIRFRNGEYVGHMYNSTGEFPAYYDWDRYPWEFDESAPHDTIIIE